MVYHLFNMLYTFWNPRNTTTINTFKIGQREERDTGLIIEHYWMTVIGITKDAWTL